MTKLNGGSQETIKLRIGKVRLRNMEGILERGGGGGDEIVCVRMGSRKGGLWKWRCCVRLVRMRALAVVVLRRGAEPPVCVWQCVLADLSATSGWVQCVSIEEDSTTAVPASAARKVRVLSLIPQRHTSSLSYRSSSCGPCRKLAYGSERHLKSHELDEIWKQQPS